MTSLTISTDLHCDAKCTSTSRTSVSDPPSDCTIANRRDADNVVSGGDPLLAANLQAGGLAERELCATGRRRAA